MHNQMYYSWIRLLFGSNQLSIVLLQVSKQMSQTYQQTQNKKSARFSSVNEVFNYTAQKTEEEDNSLLLTPKDFKSRDDDNLLSQKRSKNKEMNLNQREHREIEMKRKSLAEKKENFRRRLSTFPANCQEIDDNESNQRCQVNKEAGTVQNKLQQKIVIQQQRQMKQVDNKSKILQKQPKGNEALNSAQQKTKIAAYSQSAQNDNKSVLKIDIQENNQLSTQNAKTYKNQHKNSRITMDYRSFLMQMGIFNEQNQQKSSQQNEANKSNPDLVTSQPQNLVTKAIRRLSQEGRKVSMMKNKNRVTLNFNQIQSVLSQFQPNDTFIKSLKKEADQRQNVQLKQKEKLSQKARRQFLQKYFNQEEHRLSIVRQNLQKARFDKQRLISNIKKLDEIQAHLDQQIRLKKIESNENITKIEVLQRSRYNPQQVEQLLMPIQYLWRFYSVNIVQIVSRSQSYLCQSRSYLIKFIIDEFLYCKIIASQGENKSLVIPMPIDFEHKSQNWSLDLKLRIQLLKKYFQKNLHDCEPVATVMRLGVFWQSLQKIQSDFQMIDQLFELLELSLDESKDRLSLRIQLNYDILFDVRVNFMKVGKQGHFQIDNHKQTVMSKRKVELLQFMTEYIAGLKF